MHWGKLAGVVAAGVIGLCVVAYVFGLHILPPSHTGWMLTGTIGPDPVQYWLGWTYFRQSPWHWPPGLNPDWGLEIGSSIFYSDSIPLLAFGFKALRGLVEPSQYWGMWLYACGALQGILAWRLIGHVTENALVRVAGAALFVLQPTLLNRMGGHFALSAHFLLLGALSLSLSPLTHWRPVLWALLMLAASLVHSYLLPMVGGLWAADWFGRLVRGSGRASLAAEGLAVPGAGVLGLWLAGFFVLRGGFGGSWGGYGQMQLDLLAPFDPAPWGAFLPDLPGPDHLEVGHSYAGLGALLALLLGAIAWAWRPDWRALAARWPLLLGLGGMLAFAITPNLSIGGREVVLFEIPAPLRRVLDALRASERFIWPAAYAALLAAIAAMVRGFGARRAGLVLVALVAVQFADLQPGFARLARYFPVGPAEAPLRLSDPFWAEAAGRYGRVRLHPTGLQATWWEEVAVYAATHGMPTDAVYLARTDPDRVAALNAEIAARLEAGRYEPATLYVLGNEDAMARARHGMDPARDLLDRFNGIWVLAPGWHARPE